MGRVVKSIFVEEKVNRQKTINRRVRRDTGQECPLNPQAGKPAPRGCGADIPAPKAKMDFNS